MFAEPVERLCQSDVDVDFGVQCSRAGYTPRGKGLIKMWPTDISFLRQAKGLVERGFSVLMYDLRNHGESDPGTCPWVSWGPEEAKDVVAAVDFVRGRPEFADARLGLLSICMGASATTYAYGMPDGLATRDQIKAMVVVQPLHYRQFVKAFGMPGPLVRAGGKVSETRLGLDLDTRTFMPDVPRINVPTLVLQNRNDPWTDLDFVRAFHDALEVDKELVMLDLLDKRAAAYDDLGQHPERLADFFEGHL